MGIARSQACITVEGGTQLGLFETYRYKRTGQIFIWNYIGNWYVFFLNISIIIADINTVQTTLTVDKHVTGGSDRNRKLRLRPTDYRKVDLNIQGK